MAFDSPDWTPTVDVARSQSRRERERSRIVIQLTPSEKMSIDWLSRQQKSADLPRPFAALRGVAARLIAKTLSGPQIQKLVELRAAKLAATTAAASGNPSPP